MLYRFVTVNCNRIVPEIDVDWGLISHTLLSAYWNSPNRYHVGNFANGANNNWSLHNMMIPSHNNWSLIPRQASLIPIHCIHNHQIEIAHYNSPVISLGSNHSNFAFVCSRPVNLPSSTSNQVSACISNNCQFIAANATNLHRASWRQAESPFSCNPGHCVCLPQHKQPRTISSGWMIVAAPQPVKLMICNVHMFVRNAPHEWHGTVLVSAGRLRVSNVH